MLPGTQVRQWGSKTWIRKKLSKAKSQTQPDPSGSSGNEIIPESSCNFKGVGLSHSTQLLVKSLGVEGVGGCKLSGISSSLCLKDGFTFGICS